MTITTGEALQQAAEYKVHVEGGDPSINSYVVRFGQINNHGDDLLAAFKMAIDGSIGRYDLDPLH